ncbi:hypothetical protein [Paracidovorax konjaci]|nr:hypothetical protein [Paracidovorax konjaci]
MTALRLACIAAWMLAIPPLQAGPRDPATFWHPRHVQRFVIETPSARSFGQGQCGHLLVDEKRLRFFLAHAKPGSSTEYDHQMQTDDCNAEGRIVLKDGRRFKVSLDNWTGWGAVSNQRTTQFLFCRPCKDILEPGFAFQDPPGQRGR